MRGVLRLRSRLGGAMLPRRQLRVAYSVRVHSLEMLAGPSAAGGVAVLWTRGSKTAVTTERSLVASDPKVKYNEDLSLICTLFQEDASSAAKPRFAEKLCTFAAIESRTVGKLNGMRTIGKCKIDISEYAGGDSTTAVPKLLELRLSRNSQNVGTLRISISCRWLPESSGGTDSGGKASAAAAAVGSTATTSSASGGGASGRHSSVFTGAGRSLRFSDLSDFSEEESSDASSEVSSETSEVPQARLAELEDWPSEQDPRPPETLPDAEIDVGDALRSPPNDSSAAATPDHAPSVGRQSSSPAPQSFGGSGMVRVSRNASGETQAVRFSPQPACQTPSSSVAPLQPTSDVADRARDVAARARAASGNSPRSQTRGPATPSVSSLPPSGGGSSADGGTRRRAATTFSPAAATTPGGRAMGEVGGGSMVRGGSGGGGGHHMARVHTIAGCNASIISADLEASERSRVEADRKQLEVQLSASLGMHKKVTARLNEERDDWKREKAELVAELAARRDALLEQQTDASKKEFELRKVLSERDEGRKEVSRLKAEREELTARLQGGSDADAEDSLVVQRDLQGKLAESENHLNQVSRKMTKAHKRQENLLAQFEAEIDLLSEKVDELEDECCKAEQARLHAESAHAEAEGQVRSVRSELERYERREAIQPAGMQELADQLEMANTVKEMLVNEMAIHTDELATLKVEYAQVEADREEGVLRLRKSDEKSRRLRLRMTSLEVHMEELNNSRADDDEEKAMVFKEVMQRQETRIRELEAQLAEKQEGSGRIKRWPF